jgi:hypothetical protein
MVELTIDARERERVFWTSLAEALVIDTHHLFPILLHNKYKIGNPHREVHVTPLVLL